MKLPVKTPTDLTGEYGDLMGERLAHSLAMAKGASWGVYASEKAYGEKPNQSIEWILNAHVGTLDKLPRLLPESRLPTSLELLSAVRNLFENLIWLRLFEHELEYARGENDYVILTDDDLDNVALDTVKTIDIQKFAPAESIEWVYLEKPHYLMPDDAVGHEAFAVIRDAMKSDKVVGISKLVIGRREKAVVLEPRDDGIVLWSLRFGDEVRPEEAYFEDIDDEGDPDLIPLVQRLIKQKTARWSPEMVSDPIQESLLKLIAEKKKMLKPKKAIKGKKSEAAEPRSNVINIMDALRKSVADELKSRKSG